MGRASQVKVNEWHVASSCPAENYPGLVVTVRAPCPLSFARLQQVNIYYISHIFRIERPLRFSCQENRWYFA